MKRILLFGAAAITLLIAAGGHAKAADGQGEDYDQIDEGSQDTPVNHVETTLTENDREEAHTPVAPDLTVSSGDGDECQGSTSLGVQVVPFGISGGTTWGIDDCKGLRSSRLAFDMASRVPGMEYAAVGILCQLNDGKNVGPINAALGARGLDCAKLSGGVAPTPEQVSERAAVQMAQADTQTQRPKVFYGSNR